MTPTAVLNLGLKAIRAAVFADGGRCLAIAYRPIETQMGEGRVEQRPEEWWTAGMAVLREALDRSGVRSQVSILTVTSSAGCLVSLDSELNPIGSAIMISDVRAQSEAEVISRLASFEQHRQRGRRVTPDQMLPKILWLQRHAEKDYSNARWFVSPNDFLVARLTGQVLTDPYNASKYFYDPASRDYPKDLLLAIHVLPERLPPVVTDETSTVALRGDVRDELGLTAACRVVLSTYDAICAVYGAGVSEPGQACDVSGTVTSFRVVTDLALRDPTGSVFVSPHARPGHYLAGASNNLGGGVVEWLKQLLYRGDVDPYSAIERDSDDAPPGAAGIIFLPYLLGERAPIWDANARGVFFGLGRNHGRGDLTRAVLEGIGYSVLDIAERLRGLGVLIDRVVASGGLARISPIQQIKADMLGVPVVLCEELESTALGAAMLANLNAGEFSSITDAARASVRLGREFQPDAARFAMYQDFFGMYRSLYGSLQDLFSTRAALISRHSEVLRTEPIRTENL